MNGGGINNFQSQGTLIDGNKFVGNMASAGGGAIVSRLSNNTRITNNLISKNSANMGGGLIISSSTNMSDSGKYQSEKKYQAYNGRELLTETNQVKQQSAQSNLTVRKNSVIEIINNTFTENTAMLGGGIYTELSDVVLMNTILWGDSATAFLGAELYIDGGTVDVAYSNIDSMAAYGTMNSFLNNINCDPLFSDTLFNLSDNSQCIGTGIDSFEIGGTWYYAPPFDYNNNPRPMPDTCMPDIGAQESPLCGPLPTGFFEDKLPEIPADYSLMQNYPNPFNPNTTIEFEIPAPAGPKTEFVTLKVFNILGQELAILVSEKLNAGKYSYNWNADNLANGVYLYQLETERGFVQSKKMLLLK
jgi:hypothetical protein